MVDGNRGTCYHDMWIRYSKNLEADKCVAKVGLQCGREKPTSILRREETLALLFFRNSFSPVPCLYSLLLCISSFCGHELGDGFVARNFFEPFVLERGV